MVKKSRKIDRSDLSLIVSLCALVLSAIALMPDQPHFSIDNEKVFLDTTDDEKKEIRIQAQIKNTGG